MKTRYLLLDLLMLVFLQVGCSKDAPQAPVVSEDVQVKVIARTTGAVAQANSLNSSEDVIRCCRVFVFDGAGKLDRVQFFDEVAVTAGMNMRAKVGSDKTFCIIVNEPDLPAIKDALGSADTPDKLKAVMYELASYVDPARSVTSADGTDSPDGYTLPMYGEATVVVSADDINTVPIDLYRAVARVDIYFRIEENAYVGAIVTTTSSIELEKVPEKGYFARGNSPVVGADKRIVKRSADLVLDRASAAGNYKLAYSFYVPAQRFATDDDRYRLIVKGVDWEGEAADYAAFRFGDAIVGFDNSIQGNTRYELYCTLSQIAFSVDLALHIEDWKMVSQDSHI